MDAALPGSVIHIEPGSYAESFHVAKPDIRMLSLTGPHGEGVVIANPGGEEDGVTVTDAGAGLELLLWHGSGIGNTRFGNRFGTRFPPGLPHSR